MGETYPLRTRRRRLSTFPRDDTPTLFELWESGNWSVGERRILMTHWVYKAFERVHLEHRDAIISCFKNVGLSLAVHGSEDYLLKIRDLPDVTVGDWQRAPEGTTEKLLSMTMTMLR